MGAISVDVVLEIMLNELRETTLGINYKETCAGNVSKNDESSARSAG